MDVLTEETTTVCTERRESADQRSVSVSLWRSVVHAFRHAQLQRLEARVNRLRSHRHVVPTGYDQRVMVMAAEPQAYAEMGSTSAATPSRRAWSLTGAICTLMLAGVVLSVLVVRNRDSTAAAFLPTPAESQVRPTAQEMRELRALLTSVDERVTMLHRQVLQQGDSLTNQAATVLSMTQHGDTQQTQVTALTDALTVLTTQVAHLNQQVTAHASHLAEYEQQLVTQTTQREPVPPQPPHVNRAAAKTSGRSSRPRPPTLELLAPPSAPAGTAAPPWSAPLPAAGAQPPRRSITLPAALGVEGYRAATGTTGGTSP